MKHVPLELEERRVEAVLEELDRCVLFELWRGFCKSRQYQDHFYGHMGRAKSELRSNHNDESWL